MNTTEMRSSLERLLGPAAEPVAVSFCDEAPAGMERIGAAAPAGCSYWKLAAEGQAFYTAAEDHFNCPIGAYTHGAELTADVQGQLEGTIGMMVGLQYLKMEEVAKIPRRAQPLRFVVYAPLSKTAETPDVVLLRGNARQIMLLMEAAQARDLTPTFPIMGRPACAVIAATMESGKAATSLGCIGNRVYTGIPDDEFYVAVPGQSMGDMIDALESIVHANTELQRHHRSKCAVA